VARSSYIGHGYLRFLSLTTTNTFIAVHTHRLRLQTQPGYRATSVRWLDPSLSCVNAARLYVLARMPAHVHCASSGLWDDGSIRHKREYLRRMCMRECLHRDLTESRPPPRRVCRDAGDGVRLVRERTSW
jgi:hypothetical protein